MNSVTLAFTLFVALVSAQNSIRFVNNIEGSTLTIYSNKLPDITIPWMGATQYYAVDNGVITITNVLDQNGNSLSGGNPLLTEFGVHYTLIATMNNAETDPTKKFVLALFNESAPVNMDQSTDSTKAWVRFLDMTQDIQFLTLASPAGSVVSYAGFLTYTQYTPISASTTNMRVYKSDSQTYNSPLIIFNTQFKGLEAYTIMFFTQSSGSQQFVTVVDDRVVGTGLPATTTGDAASTTGVAATTTGVAATTTGVAATATGDASTSMPVTTRMVPQTPTTRATINNVENSSSRLVVGIASLAVMLALL